MSFQLNICLYSVFNVQTKTLKVLAEHLTQCSVGLRRLELPTSRLSGVRSNRLSYKPILIKRCYLIFSSGDGEIRTLDPLLARQVLSQLSYAPLVPYIYYTRYSFL